jgi:hypothetical protein
MTITYNERRLLRNHILEAQFGLRSLNDPDLFPTIEHLDRAVTALNYLAIPDPDAEANEKTVVACAVCGGTLVKKDPG